MSDTLNIVIKNSFISIIMSIIVFLGCEERTPKNIDVIPGKAKQYLSFDISSANHLIANKTDKNTYSLKTTGVDPYIYTEKLKQDFKKGHEVLTFEYKCNEEISSPQFFLGPIISESRSIKAKSLSNSTSWKVASFNLYKKKMELSWGSIGDFLRIDFGNKSGVHIEIRNIYFRSMTDEEEKIIKEEEDKLMIDKHIDSTISSYLSNQFTSKITEVGIKAKEISISGIYTGNRKFSLCEILPIDTLTTTTNFNNKIELKDNEFKVSLNRTGNINGSEYDRLHSKWVIVEEHDTKDKIVSHARYADIIEPSQKMTPKELSGKKGLGGFFINSFQNDLDLLNIQSITINIPFTSFMYTTQGANRIEHKYYGKTYFFAENEVLNSIDKALKVAAEKEIVVAAIILVQKASECVDPDIGRLLQHPDFTSEGIFSMPNLTTFESAHCYAAALDFLSSRYNRLDNAFGRIHKWIMHNEVDAGLTWTNMGKKPMLVFLDTYIKSMRMCYNISREYDESSEVMGSFTHSWTEPVEEYSSKELLTNLQKFCDVEGDFQWGIAYHPYPQDLNEPKTWNDSKATFNKESKLVTFKNLEVIDDWVKNNNNKYQGVTKRTLWLSENGTNSRTYEEQDLKEQAAGFAYAWKKIMSLDGIDGIQWHNWIDNRAEYGLRIGLRKFKDDEIDPGGTKPVWHAYKVAGTEEEDIIFNQYKSIIGINSWHEIMQVVN